MSTSFPFLKIARDFGLPYGEVLRTADQIEATPNSLIERQDGRGPALFRAIRYAIDRERVRREHVRAEAGL